MQKIMCLIIVALMLVLHYYLPKNNGILDETLPDTLLAACKPIGSNKQYYICKIWLS